MAQGRLQYDRMIDDALRGVVRRALAIVAESGLPGGHHFLVTYKTDCPGVGMPDYLRTRYPDTISIMLQFEFWNLEVDDDGFAVTLSFNDVRERLSVPWRAVTGFVDPFAKFQLKFEPRYDGEPAPAAARRDKQPTQLKPADAAKHESKSDDKDRAKSGEIVTLDAFRKK
jgi:hypothetical protein